MFQQNSEEEVDIKQIILESQRIFLLECNKTQPKYDYICQKNKFILICKFNCD